MSPFGEKCRPDTHKVEKTHIFVLQDVPEWSIVHVPCSMFLILMTAWQRVEPK